MAFAHVQGNSDSTDSGGATFAVTLNGITGGNLLVVWIKFENNPHRTLVSVSDGTSAFTLDTETDHSNGELSGCFAYLLSANAGNKTITATFDDTNTYTRMFVSEFSYSDTCEFDTSAQGQGNSASLSSGNFTTTGTNELVVAGFGEYSSTTTSSEQIAGSAATEPAYSPEAWSSIWYLATTVSNDDATASIDSSNWVCNAIAFKEVAAGGTEKTNTGSMGDLAGAAVRQFTGYRTQTGAI